MKKIWSALLLGVVLFGSIFSVAMAADTVVLTTVTTAKQFGDVPLTHKNYTAIQDLAARGIIAGYSDGNFRPAETVNRAEALKIILKAAGVTVGEAEDLNFSDINSAAWYAKYITAAVKNGIVNGYPDGTFQPEKTVNRAEALKMLIKSSKDDPGTPTEEKIYNDVYRDQWFGKYVWYAQTKNIVEPLSENVFAADQGMTRGDVAEMMYRKIYITEHQLPSFPKDKNIQVIEGKATYYSDDLQGKNTASGEPYDVFSYTGASRYLPLGTMVRVVNKANNKAVVVKINDRNAENDRNIVIDLSRIAFTAIADINSGIIDVRVEVLGENKALYKRHITKGFFENINLTQELPTVFTKGENYLLEGTVSSTEKTVVAFYVDDKNVQTSFTTKVTDGKFSLPIDFDRAGTFSLAIVPGSQQRGKAANIFVVDYPQTTEVNPETAITTFSVSQLQGEVRFAWKRPANTAVRLVVEQGDKRLEKIFNSDGWLANPKYFSGWQSGDASVYIETASLSSDMATDRYTTWRASPRQTIDLTNLENKTYDETKIHFNSLPQYVQTGETVNFRGSTTAGIRNEAAVISPAGQIIKIPLTRDGDSFSFSLPVIQKGTYLVEINLTTGEAIFNYPFYNNTQYPLIPETVNRELVEKVDLPGMRAEMLELVNGVRQTQGLSMIGLSTDLNNLAQFKAEDMLQKKYFAHQDAAGHDINYFAPTYLVYTAVRENLAKRNAVSTAFADLMKSAIHSDNILTPGVERMGVGIVSDATDNQIIFVQLLSVNELTDTGKFTDSLRLAINSQRTSPLVLSTELSKAAEQWLPFAGETNSQTVLQELTGKLAFKEIYGTGIYFPPFVYSESSVADIVKNLTSKTEILNGKWDSLGVSVQLTAKHQVVVTILFGTK